MKLMKRYLTQLWRQKEPMNRKMLLDLLDKNTGANILDIGCNDGSFTKAVANKVGTDKIYGIEFMKEYAEIAYKSNGVCAVLANADRSFPFKDCSFDIVISNQVIEHVCDTDNFVKEIYRVLVGGGYLYSFNR